MGEDNSQMTLAARLFSHPSDAIAVVTGEGQVSYGEFRADVERATASLGAHGIGPGSTVGIHFGPFRHSDDYGAWVAHVAAMRVGAAHASVYDARSLSEILNHAPLDAIVGCKPQGFDQDIKIIEIDSPPATKKAVADQEGQAVRLNLTSGTTGTPKIVRWDSAMMAARVDQLSDLGVIGPDTLLDSHLAPRTTAGFRYPLATWIAGGSVLLSSRGEFDDLDRATQATLCACSPFQLQRMRARNVRWPNRGARTIVTLGGRVPPGLRDWALANLAGKVIISYGSTEAGNVAHGDAMATDRHPGAVGWIRKDAEVQIVDSDGKRLGPGEVGRVRLRTDVLVRASDRPDGKDDEWFEPGDIGVIFEDGLFAIGGRGSDVLNVSGVKISAVDLESKLSALDRVLDASVAAASGTAGDLLLVCLVLDRGVAPGSLLPPVTRIVAGVPFRMFSVRSIPRNAMGKVDRRRLIEQVRNHVRTAQQLKKEHV
jgi:acyl-CoA synthetase (AMP-forming)/AMP-acid ligase II